MKSITTRTIDGETVRMVATRKTYAGNPAGWRVTATLENDTMRPPFELVYPHVNVLTAIEAFDYVQSVMAE